MYAYFSKATLENKQFPLDSKRRSEQSIHILNENKLALGSLRKRVDKEELTHGQKENYTYLILCTVSGVAAGLQNTG